MTVETQSPTGEITKSARVLARIGEPTDGFFKLLVGSEWPQDQTEMEQICPNPPPEGLMFRPSYETITVRGRQVERLTFTPIYHKPAIKPGVLDHNAMSDDQLRVWLDEHDVVREGDTKAKPWTRTRLLEALAKVK